MIQVIPWKRLHHDSWLNNNLPAEIILLSDDHKRIRPVKSKFSYNLTLTCNPQNSEFLNFNCFIIWDISPMLQVMNADSGFVNQVTWDLPKSISYLCNAWSNPPRRLDSNSPIPDIINKTKEVYCQWVFNLSSLLSTEWDFIVYTNCHHRVSD